MILVDGTANPPRVTIIGKKGKRPKKEEKVDSKIKAHIRYKNDEGRLIPGTTTITGLLAKPALIGWANRLGLEGIDCNKYKDKMADIGILGHYFVMADFKGISEEAKQRALEEYSAINIDKAENCILPFSSGRKGTASNLSWWRRQSSRKPISSGEA